MNRTISTLAGVPRKLDGGILFGHTPRLTWAQWMKPDLDNKVEIASRALLVQQEGRNILVLAGTDALLAPIPRTCRCRPSVFGLLENLAQHGLCEDDIDAVLLTHLQAPLSDELNERVREGEMPRLLFRKARYLAGGRHWKRARHPHPRDRDLFVPPLLHRLENSGRLILIEGNTCDTLGNGWHIHFSDGFTPGQLLPEIVLPGGPVLFVGDLIPGMHWMSLNVNSAYDRNPECVAGDKERLLDHLVATRGRLIFSQDPDIAMVKIMRDRQSRYVPFDPYTSLSRFEN